MYRHFLMRLLLTLYLGAGCPSAFADQFYLTVNLKCDASSSELLISLDGKWNESSELLSSQSGLERINPRSLVKFSQDDSGNYSIEKKVEHRVCQLGKHVYDMEILPFMSPRFHPEGFCATRIGASVDVRLHGKIVASLGVDACTEGGLVTTGVKVRPGAKPKYEVVDARQFYGT
jgi:hypothetical protein